MTNYPSDTEARLALHGVEQARRRVIDQIGMPWWYWWGLAGCWIGLGIAADVANPWVTLAALLTFGAATRTSRHGCWRAGSARVTSRSGLRWRGDVLLRSSSAFSSG